MTPGFGTQQMPDTTIVQPLSFVYFRQRFHVQMAAYTALPAARVNWGF
jgi:hypothetical protein